MITLALFSTDQDKDQFSLSLDGNIDIANNKIVLHMRQRGPHAVTAEMPRKCGAVIDISGLFAYVKPFPVSTSYAVRLMHVNYSNHRPLLLGRRDRASFAEPLIRIELCSECATSSEWQAHYDMYIAYQNIDVAATELTRRVQKQRQELDDLFADDIDNYLNELRSRMKVGEDAVVEEVTVGNLWMLLDAIVNGENFIE